MDGNMASWWSMTSRFCQQYGQQDRPNFTHQGPGFWSQMQEQNETIQGQAAEIARLKHLIQLRDNDIATLSRQENNHINVQIKILNNNISELSGLAKVRESTIHKLEILLEKERRKVRKISSQNVRLKDQRGKENVPILKNHILRKTSQQDQTSKNQEFNSQNSSKIKELTRTNDEMNKELKANHLKIGNLESALKLKENELKNVSEAQGDLKKELYASDETLKDLKGQLKTKDDLIAELTKNSDNIKNQEEKVNHDKENIDQLNTRIQELTKENCQLQNDSIANNSNKEHLESAFKLKGNVLKNAAKDHGELKKQLNASDEIVKDLKDQLKTKDDMIAELTKNSNNIKNQEEKVNHDQENIDQLNTRIQELTKENFQLQKDSKASNSNEEHLESALKLKENELKNAAKDHVELKKQLYAIDETVKDLKDQLKTKDNMIAELTKNSHDNQKNEQEEISQLNNRIFQLTEKSDKLMKESKVSDMKIENLEASLTVRNKELVESMKNNAELKADIESIKNLNEELQIKNNEKVNDELISNLQTSVETIDGLKAKLKLKDKMLLDNTENFIKVNENLNCTVRTVQHLENKIRMKNDLIVQLSEKVDDVEKDNQFKNEQLRSKECEINDKNSEIFQLKIDRMECRLEITELENQLSSKIEDLKAATDNLESVKKLKRELDCESKEHRGVCAFSEENVKEENVVKFQNLPDDSKRGQKRSGLVNQDEIVANKMSRLGEDGPSEDESATIAEFCEKVKMEVKSSVCIKKRADCVRRSCQDCRLVIKDLFQLKSRELVGMTSGKPGEIMRALRTQAFLNVTGYCPD